MAMDVSVVLEIIFDIAMRGGIYTLIALGLSLIFGVIKIINYAQGSFFMLGTFVAYFLITLIGVNPFFAVVLSGLLMFIIGVLIEKSTLFPLRRVSGKDWLLNSLVLTLGLSIIFESAALSIWGAEYRGIPFLWKGSVKFLGATFTFERLIILVSSVGILITMWYLLARTNLGKALRAVAQEKDVSSIMGINVDLMYTAAFGIGAALSGFAGALILPLTMAYPSVGNYFLLKAFVVLFLGGLGSSKGTLFGGFALACIESITFMLLSAGWQNVVSLLVVIVILVVKPEGVFAEKK